MLELKTGYLDISLTESGIQVITPINGHGNGSFYDKKLAQRKIGFDESLLEFAGYDVRNGQAQWSFRFKNPESFKVAQRLYKCN